MLLICCPREERKSVHPQGMNAYVTDKISWVLFLLLYCTLQEQSYVSSVFCLLQLCDYLYYANFMNAALEKNSCSES